MEQEHKYLRSKNRRRKPVLLQKLKEGQFKEEVSKDVTVQKSQQRPKKIVHWIWQSRDD